MSDYLSLRGVEAFASGKTILLGEHSAVYGFPAVATPLHDVKISVGFVEPSGQRPQSWLQAWHFSGSGTVAMDADGDTLSRLKVCLTRGVEFVFARALETYAPQFIAVRSDIPLGAGMGGSAALSVALLRALLLAAGKKDVSEQEFLQAANHMDGAFHGSASGLDVAAVSAAGPIVFEKGRATDFLRVGREFWLVLVDSGFRSPTIDMVGRVAALKEAHPQCVGAMLERLGNLAREARVGIEQGSCETVGAAMNEAHSVLFDLGVSHPVVDVLVEQLRTLGALGAKLTGAGGGGLVLGLFSHPPVVDSWNVFRGRGIYVTRVLKTNCEVKF
jgi:mevalonate kinase